MKGSKSECDGCPSCTRVKMLDELLERDENEKEGN